MAGVFSDNGFHMIQETKEIIFTAREATNIEKINSSLEIISLYDTMKESIDNENDIVNVVNA